MYVHHNYTYIHWIDTLNSEATTQLYDELMNVIVRIFQYSGILNVLIQINTLPAHTPLPSELSRFNEHYGGSVSISVLKVFIRIIIIWFQIKNDIMQSSGMCSGSIMYGRVAISEKGRLFNVKFHTRLKV